MLPIIFQHVRELAEIHSGDLQSDRYKVITPFPPVGSDFKDFKKESLEFTDPQVGGEAAEASLDTIRAHDFFEETDNLYYDFSYGIKSQDYFLSHICQDFYQSVKAKDAGDNRSFATVFNEKKNAFLIKYNRITAGDQGELPFKYTSPSPIQWNDGKVVIASQEIERLKEKALTVYENLQISNQDFLKSLITEISATNYSKIEYDFGFFDVNREWVNPQLFESDEWEFKTDRKFLYGENDADFESNDINLCYAQRFYIIKNYSAVTDNPASLPPIIRDHRFEFLERTGSGSVFGRPFEVRHRAVLTPVRDHRQDMRDKLINLKLSQITSRINPGINRRVITPTSRPGFVWIEATSSIPGHWEREKVGIPKPETTPDDELSNSVYKIAAVKCRVVFRKPQI